jgi:hypothetical protein
VAEEAAKNLTAARTRTSKVVVSLGRNREVLYAASPRRITPSASGSRASDKVSIGSPVMSRPRVRARDRPPPAR